MQRLRALEQIWQEEGLSGLRSHSDPLVPLGTEIDAQGRVSKYGYGLFSLSSQARSHPEWPELIRSELEELRSGLRTAHGVSLRYLLWAGMGGSAEDKSMYEAVGLLRRGVRCYVLDSTDPSKLRCILADMTRRQSLPRALRSTLVVGMAMGMTSYEPVVNIQKLTALYERHGIDSRANLAYMTLPGSLLDRFAGPRGYRRIELQPDGENTTSGRHTGPLTRGSLYPLALAGNDLRRWIRATFLSDRQIHTAWRLAAFLHGQGAHGRDKVVLQLPREWRGAGIWTKQDFEESLGKSEDLGLKIFVGEKLHRSWHRPPGDARQDRVFLCVLRAGARRPARFEALRRAGYPCAVLTLPARAELSTYMQFMHCVVFGIAYLRGMNFVTQPSVELYKSITNKLFAEAEERGGPRETSAWKKMTASPRRAEWRGGLTLVYDGIRGAAPDRTLEAPRLYRSLMDSLLEEGAVEYGELTFFGDTRYCPRGRAVREALDRAGDRLFRARLKIPVDVYEGPAMNHSYHEMIIGHGKCFSTIVISEKQERIPEAGYEGDYHLTQFLATKLALQRRGRHVVALLMKDLGPRSLATLADFFEHARA